MLFSDVYLYVALALGWVTGRLRPSRSRWVPRATFASVILLLGLLGASFRDLTGAELVGVLPAAVIFASGVLGATAVAYLLLARLSGPPHDAASVDASRRPERLPSSVLLLAALLVGFVVGRLVEFPAAAAVPWALAGLLALVGYSLEVAWEPMRRAWLPIGSSVAGAAIGALGLTAFFRLSAPASWGTSLAFGWYSLAGPVVATRFGATVGLFAFLANYLRELFTMLLAPYLGPRLRGEGLAALGGATSMDTTLYFVVRYGTLGPEAWP